MATISAAKVALLNKMNQIAKKTGLGTLLDSYAGSHKILAAGSFTTAGGDANEAITVSGATSSDIALVVLHTKGASPVTILTAQAATDAINVVMSGDPSTDHVLKYMVIRTVS